MADYRVPITLPDTVLHDEWLQRIVFGVDSDVLDGKNLLRVRLGMKSPSGAVTMFDTEEPYESIHITDAVTRTAYLDETRFNLAQAGVWIGDVEFYFDGYVNPITLYTLSVTVHEDITK